MTYLKLLKPICMVYFGITSSLGNANSPDPAQVSLKSVSTIGNGCPNGNTRVKYLNQSEVIEITYDNYFAEKGSGVPSDYEETYCVTSIALDVPQGWSYSIKRARYKTDVEAGFLTSVSHASSHYFEGNFGQREQLVERKRGPYSNPWIFQHRNPIRVDEWSPCNENTTLHVGMRLKAHTTGSGYAYIEMYGKQNLEIDWKRCGPVDNGSPVLSGINNITFYDKTSDDGKAPYNSGSPIVDCYVVPSLPQGVRLDSQTCRISAVSNVSESLLKNYVMHAVDADGDEGQLAFTLQVRGVFVSTWDTTLSNSDQSSINFPLLDWNNSQPYAIDWGDGTPLNYFNSGGKKAHQYANPGVYQIKVYATSTGEMPNFSFGNSNSNDAIKILSIDSIGDMKIGNTFRTEGNSFRGAFAFARNLRKIEGKIKGDNLTDVSSLFVLVEKLESVDLSELDVSQVTDMSSMFSGASSLQNLEGISSFDTSKVTNMSYMFSLMINLDKLNVLSFDTSKVTNMSHMFSTLRKIGQLDLINFDTSKVDDMSYMFWGTSSLRQLDVTGWDLSNVTSSAGVFIDTHPLLDVYCDQGGSRGTGSFFGKPCH